MLPVIGFVVFSIFFLAGLASRNSQEEMCVISSFRDVVAQRSARHKTNTSTGSLVDLAIARTGNRFGPPSASSDRPPTASSPSRPSRASSPHRLQLPTLQRIVPTLKRSESAKSLEGSPADSRAASPSDKSAMKEKWFANRILLQQISQTNTSEAARRRLQLAKGLFEKIKRYMRDLLHKVRGPREDVDYTRKVVFFKLKELKTMVTIDPPFDYFQGMETSLPGYDDILDVLGPLVGKVGEEGNGTPFLNYFITLWPDLPDGISNEAYRPIFWSRREASGIDDGFDAMVYAQAMQRYPEWVNNHWTRTTEQTKVGAMVMKYFDETFFEAASLGQKELYTAMIARFTLAAVKTLWDIVSIFIAAAVSTGNDIGDYYLVTDGHPLPHKTWLRIEKPVLDAKGAVEIENPGVNEVYLKHYINRTCTSALDTMDFWVPYGPKIYFDRKKKEIRVSDADGLDSWLTRLKTDEGIVDDHTLTAELTKLATKEAPIPEPTFFGS